MVRGVRRDDDAVHAALLDDGLEDLVRERLVELDAAVEQREVRDDLGLERGIDELLAQPQVVAVLADDEDALDRRGGRGEAAGGAPAGEEGDEEEPPQPQRRAGTPSGSAATTSCASQVTSASSVARWKSAGPWSSVRLRSTSWSRS